MSTIPEGLKYSKEHEWLKITEEKTEDGLPIAIVGITDFAQGELGELVYVEVDTVGDEIAIDEVFGTVEAVKTTSDLFIPVTAKILEFNPLLNEDDGDQPELINSDPFGDGWVVKIALTNMDELEGLMSAEQYADMIS